MDYDVTRALDKPEICSDERYVDGEKRLMEEQKQTALFRGDIEDGCVVSQSKKTAGREQGQWDEGSKIIRQ